MQNETRVLYNQYLARQAQLNGVHRDDINQKFNVAPSVQQRLEAASMESNEFMKRINIFGVDEQEGQKVLIGSRGPIASTNNTSDGSVRRNPRDNHSKEPFNYRCRKTNYDTSLSYAQIDTWAHEPAFQSLISAANAQQIALDRMMIGWNGEAYSETSDATKYPLLQDCGIGWLQKIRDEAKHRVMSGATLTSRDEDNKIVARGSYGSLDALVYDVKSSLLEPWHRRAPDLVVIMPSDLMTSINFPRLNALSQTNPNSEAIAGQLIVSAEKIGGLPTFLAPYIPDDVVLITSFKNLSVYYQRGSMRRHIQEEPHYNRIATYQSSNDDFVVEDYGKVAMIDGIKFATAE